MALRKRIEREKAKVSAETKEDDVPSDRNDVAPLVAARELRRQEREHKSKNKEMTEEEMMALALQLSEQEANITAQRLQEEEEAMRKAIQDSIFVDVQGLMDAVAPPGVSSRRKLVYSNGESTTDHGESQGQRAAGHVNKARKRHRVEGSPLKEMPDLSQTQPSPSSSESAALGFQSPQSCDSTQIEGCDVVQSPVLTSPSAQVRVCRLNQDLLDSCAVSGFVICSQDSGVPIQSSHCHQPSPTFPKSPVSFPQIPASKVEAANSQMFDLGDDTQPELSQEARTSPVFGRTDCTSALQADIVEATALSFSSQESSVTSSLDKEVSLIKSPVFSKTQVGGSDRGECQSPVFGTNGRTVMSQGDELEEQEDEKAEEEQSLSQTEPTIDMTLHWSEEDEDNATPVVSPSPVFPEERRHLPSLNDNEESAPSQTQHRSATPQSGSAVKEAACSSGDSAPQSTVHYYWGVPFCPRGLDPDQYTKVIVAQMEVYEKSLKQAQRGLLNKAKWGEPILPQPEKSPSSEPNSPPMILPTRRSWRLRCKQKELESEEETEEVTENMQRSHRSLWEEEDAHVEGDKEMKQYAGEEDEAEQQRPVLEDKREAETQRESDCEFCPETQLSDDNTQELTLPSQPLVRSPEIEMVQVDSPNVPEPQTPVTPEPEEPMVQGPESAEEPMESTKPGDMDLEGPHCESQSRKCPQQSQSPQPDPNSDPNPDLQEQSSPDLGTGPDLGSSTESQVQCPLCQQTFPSDQIEMHAAFCDGAPEAGDKASSKPRRKRMRRGETEKPNHTDHEPSVALEKCYICQKLVPLRDYSLHTSRCLQRPQLRTANTGRLLSALDQSEPRDSEAGPSGSTAKPHEVINLVDDDDEEDSVSLIKISNSPIRSFTPISEAQDCLIDFSRQHQGKRPATRLGTKQRSKRR